MGLRRGRFIVLRRARPRIITAVSTPRPSTSPRSLHPASDHCLPRHRQAVRLQCFYHCRVVDVFTDVSFHRWPALLSTGGERASLMAIA